jgi:hypothetical protein
MSAEAIQTETSRALETEVAARNQTEEARVQAQTDQAPVATDTPMPSPTVTVTPTIAHVMIPVGSGPVQYFVADKSSASTASQKTTSADSFELNLFERPFTSEVMDYLNYLDLRRGEMNITDPWVYVTLQLEGDPAVETEAMYGVEIDMDLDGRGDWLIIGQTPPTTEWTTDGVKACTDFNIDVGGPQPILADPPSTTRDGYEDCVFDSGIGTDPDAAWIRRGASGNSIELAFKHTLINLDTYFMWAVWSNEGVPEPALYDLNDSFTVQQAGSPVSSYALYPIKEVHSLDNTCRWAYGFEPDGSEPGVCYVPPTPTPTPACSEDINSERACIAAGGRWVQDPTVITHVAFRCSCP